MLLHGDRRNAPESRLRKSSAPQEFLRRSILGKRPQQPFRRLQEHWLVALCTLLVIASRLSAQTSVLTRSFDNARTGANTKESILTPARVLGQGLTKAFSLSLGTDDPRIEAQPLYVPGVTMSDGVRHDVIYLFSMSNHVWAFDAKTGAAIWAKPSFLGEPFLPKLGDAVDSMNINRSFGILSTPVIDLQAGLIYLVDWDTNDAAHQNRSIHLNAIRLNDGQRPPEKPALLIQASMTNSAGQVISLNQVQKQRAALLLTLLQSQAVAPGSRTLNVAFTGTEAPSGDGDPRKALHGWVVAFDVDAWKQAGAWVSTPNTFGGGIWQASQGPAADENGNVYLMTANGGYVGKNGTNQDVGIGKTDFPESFIKLTRTITPQGSSLTLSDWFIPFRDSIRKNWSDGAVKPFPKGYDYQDQDLGSAGPILPPGTSLLLGAGKDGILYVLDRRNFGKVVGDFSKLKVSPTFFTYDPDPNVLAYHDASPTSPQQDYKPMLGVKTHHLHGSPLYWNSQDHGPMVFAWGENGTLRAFTLDPSGKTRLVAHGSDVASADLAALTKNSLGGMPGGMLAASSDGPRNGIIWATAPVSGDANREVRPGVVRAYDASNFGPGDLNPDAVPRLQKIWESSGFKYSKFCPPVVADGRLIVPTYDGRVDVFILKALSAEKTGRRSLFAKPERPQ
jgi:outer membrane protein assembly factor BamB